MLPRGTKVWVFLIALCFLLLILGERVGGRLGLLLGLLIAVGLNGLIFLFGETRLLSFYKTHPLKGRDPWGLLEKVRALSEKLELRRVPHVHLMESETPTAFAVGFTLKDPSLCISTGLLDKLDDEELEAVLAHQLCQLHRMEGFSFGVSSLLANTLLGIAQFLDHLWPPNFFLEKRQRPFLTLLSPLGWLIIQAVVSRKTHSRSDLEAAELIADRERMAEVLWRLEGLAQTRPLDAPPGTSHLFIVNPEGDRQKNFFLRSHPPIENRLRSLVGTSRI